MSLLHDEPYAAALTLDLWDELVWDERDDQAELVRGHVEMVPAESAVNRWITGELAFQLRSACPRQPGGVSGGLAFAPWRVLGDFDVVLVGDPAPTVRKPDVAVVRGDAPLAQRISARDLLLAAEVVSPSSRARDLYVKRHEYAAAGIPAYLIADPTTHRLTLLTSPDELDYRESLVAQAGETVAWQAPEGPVQLTFPILPGTVVR